MKKILLLLAVVALLGSTVTSCKVRGSGVHCPAYGKVHTAKKLDKYS